MKKMITIIAIIVLLATSVTVSAAIHTHIFGTWVYYSTTQDGSYQHQYINGYIKGTTIPTYGTCTVCCETEIERLKCDGCNVTIDKYRSTSYECHGACQLGTVKN